MKTASTPNPMSLSGPAADRYGTDEKRWAAVVSRDRNADGRFFYSVSTTGVYCRPGCASRLPRREHVDFHSSSEAAQEAGFRPCKRCQPDGTSLAQHHAAVIAKACRIIKTAREPLNLATMARLAGMSPFHFHRVFTRLVGVTPKAFAGAHRADRIREQLRGRRSVTEAIYEAGYSSNSRFYSTSSQMLGMRPKDFRRGGPGTTIRFTVVECFLGSVLVGASETGVCAIFLGSDSEKLTRELQDCFPRARLIGSDRDFERLVSRVIDFIEGPRDDSALPLDIRGTAFQQRVWQKLREIPRGSTRTYSDIALDLGRPRGARAVAGACAANRLAVVVPCHRVVRTDGSLSGYRWGVSRKAKLLQKERASQRSSGAAVSS